MKHLNIIIKGKVQGVFFRKFTHSKATQLGVKGFVKNLNDGSVYVEAEGDHNILDIFVEWCHDGSPTAQVDEVITEEGEYLGFTEFELQR